MNEKKSRSQMTPAEYVVYMCEWHNSEPQGPPIGPDREWAMGFLDRSVDDGDISEWDANELRKQLGWEYQSTIFD